MKDQLIREILLARQRVYSLAPATPLQKLDFDLGFECFLKREDLSPIYAYKWRGAYNRMALLNSEKLAQGVVTASAFNLCYVVGLFGN